MSEINASLNLLDAYCNVETEANDIKSLSQSIVSAKLEEIRIDPDKLEELAEVKPLHDRIHSIVISLRIARNNLERMEYEADTALQRARELIRSIEQPEDHEL